MKNTITQIFKSNNGKRTWLRSTLALLTICVFAVGAALVFMNRAPEQASVGDSMVDSSILEPRSAHAQATEYVYNPLALSEAGAPPPSPTPGPTPQPTPLPAPGDYDIVFVSRQIPDKGSIYLQDGGMLPGTGPYSRVVVAAPGKLQILEADGDVRTLIDGSNPTAATFNLIDVNGPEVSYDGNKIVFSGLPAGDYPTGPNRNPGAWRIFKINVDGTGLQQLTFSDQNLDLSQFSGNSFQRYDDFDPVWMPDGRIVFASTRWPSLAMYNDSRTSNLHIMNADGSNMYRITSERNGAERPLVDPLTGRIVYSRWWRNFRNAANDMNTIISPFGDGYTQHLGLVAESQSSSLGGGPEADLARNSWMLTSINPDGTDVQQFAGQSGIGSHAFANQAYGGSFAADGSIYTAYYPMHHLSEAAGFGGIRHYQRGPQGNRSVIGITTEGEHVRANPPSYRVFKGNYAADPEVLPDGRLLISWAADTRQDYGLYRVNPNGQGLQLLYDNPGTTEIRPRVIVPRPLPPIIQDSVTDTPSLLPPRAQGPYDQDGTFVFNALNVYFNAPVDADIVSAIPVGSAATIRFFIDHQRTSTGFAERMDWPILLAELPVSPSGAVVDPNAPANVPLFEQIRTAQPGYDVPLTGGYSRAHYDTGAAHVAGHNFGRPGTVATCVGCHAGHTMIPVPGNPADAQWTNLAPGATVSVSSIRSDIGNEGYGLVDRRVQLGEGIERFWVAGETQSQTGQWIMLTFPVPIEVRTVRLYTIPETSNLGVSAPSARVMLFDGGTTAEAAATQTVTSLTESGTDVNFDPVWTRTVRIELDDVLGGGVGLAEIEVIARAGANP